MRFPRVKRRHILLLEVLIAFALVALCAIPLIYPHIAILKTEREFVSKVELDHVVNLLYANRIEKLYKKEIAWSDIENEKDLPIDHQMLEAIGYSKEIPFQGTYRFSESKHKPPNEPEDAAYLFKLIFTFIPKWGSSKNIIDKNGPKPLVYEYEVTIERKIK